MRKLMRILGALVLGMLAYATAGPAKAALVFELNISDCCGTGPFGTGTLTQGGDAQTVHVSVDLFPPNAFVATGGPHHALAWNIAGQPTVVLANITAGFGNFQTQGAASPFGDFGYTIDCLVPAGCGVGGSNPNPGPLEFDVISTGLLSPGSFAPNADGVYFAVDIIALGVDGAPTGNVGTLGSRGVNPQDVPEPATLTLFGLALAGLIWLSRRKSEDDLGHDLAA